VRETEKSFVSFTEHKVIYRVTIKEIDTFNVVLKQSLEEIINALRSFDCDSDEDFVGFE
jgi:hypothetical protein